MKTAFFTLITSYLIAVPLDVSVDLLFFRAEQSGTENLAQVLEPNGSNLDIKIVDLNFPFDLGYRVGAGYRFCYDNWDTQIHYTKFEQNGKTSAATTGQITSSFLGNFHVENADGAKLAGATYKKAEISWNLDYKIIDVELGKNLILSDAFEIRPFASLIGGWIDQSIDSTWQTPLLPFTFSEATESILNDFYGLGPALGANTVWNLKNCNNSAFSLFGDLSCGLLWGRWNLDDVYRNDKATYIKIKQNTIYAIGSMIKGFTGFGWSKTFANDAKITLRLGYEAQVWFNQLQFYSLNVGRLCNELTLQGGTFSCHLQF